MRVGISVDGARPHRELGDSAIQSSPTRIVLHRMSMTAVAGGDAAIALEGPVPDIIQVSARG